MSFAKLAATVLTSVLGEYVDGLDPANLEVSVLQGSAVMRNLKLKNSVFDRFNLPVTVKEGYLGMISISVPWTKLESQSTVVNIRDLYILAVPSTKNPSDQESMQQSKMSRLSLAAVMGYDMPEETVQEGDGNTQPAGYFDGLRMKVIDNLQVYIDDFHVRYEDFSNPTKPFSVGVTMSGIHIRSTDQNWEEMFMTEFTDVTYKLLSLNKFLFYFDTNPTAIQYANDEEFSVIMKDKIASPCAKTSTPISCTVKADILKTKNDFSRPQAIFNVHIQEVSSFLDENEYECINNWAKWLTVWNTVKPKFEKPEASPSEDPAGWWRYVYQATMDNTRQMSKRWSWEYMRDREIARVKYIALYKKKIQGVVELQPEEAEEFAGLEVTYEYDDLLLWRKMCNTTIKYETDRMKEIEKKKQEHASKQSYFSRVWGSTGDEVMSEEFEEMALKDLYKSIGFEEEKSGMSMASHIYPPDYVKTKISLSLSSARFRLETRDNSKIVEFNMKDFFAETLMIPAKDASLIHFAIKDVKVSDYFTLKGRTLDLVLVDQQKIESEALKDSINSVLEVDVNTKPTDSGALASVCIKTQPIIFTFSRPVVERCREFFQSQTMISGIQSAKIDKGIEAVTKELERKMKYALDAEPQVDITMDIRSMTVIIPANLYATNCPALIIDSGHLHLSSDLLARKRQDENINARIHEYFYDTYNLKWNNICAYSTHNYSRWPIPESETVRFLPKLDLDVRLKVKQAPIESLPSIRLIGEIPKFSVHLAKEYVLDILTVTKTIFQQTSPASATNAAKGLPESESTTASSTRPFGDPSSPNKSPTSGEYEVMKSMKNSAYKRKNSYASENLPLGMEKDENINTSIETTQLKLEFIIHEMEVIIDHAPIECFDAEPELEDFDRYIIPLVSINFRRMNCTVQVGQEETQFDGYLHSFYILNLRTERNLLETLRPTREYTAEDMPEGLADTSSSGHASPLSPVYIMSSILAQENVNLLELSFHSSEDESVTTCKLDRVDFNMDRPVVALMIHSVNEIVDLLAGIEKPVRANKPQTATKQKPQQVEDSLSYIAEAPLLEFKTEPALEKKKPLSIFRFKAKQFNINLREDRKLFIIATLTDFEITNTTYATGSPVSKENTIVMYDGHLSGMQFTNVASENWKKLISVPKGGKAVKIKFVSYPKALSTVIGYDTSMNVDFCSMEFVYFQETTQHLWNYIMEYFDMVDLLSGELQETELVSPDTEEIRKMKLEVTITNPFFILPVNDKSKEHVVVDLGIVELKRNYYQSPGMPLLSKLHFKAQSLTVLSRQFDPLLSNKLRSTLIVPHTFANGSMVSPLRLNENHFIPDTTLNASFSPITFNLNLAQVSLLLNVKNENLSKDFKMDLTELNAVRFVTGSRPKIDPRVLIAQNINEWVYNHVLIHVEQLLINMPAKEGECIPPTSTNAAQSSQAETGKPKQWTANASTLKTAFVKALATVAEDTKGLNKQMMDELFTAPTGDATAETSFSKSSEEEGSEDSSEVEELSESIECFTHAEMFPKDQGLICFQIVNGMLEYIQSTKNNVTYHSTVQDIAVIYNGDNETTLLHFNRAPSQNVFKPTPKRKRSNANNDDVTATSNDETKTTESSSTASPSPNPNPNPASARILDARVSGGFDAANKLGDNAIAIDYLIQAEEEAMDVEMSSPIFIPSHEALEGLYFFTTNLSSRYYEIQERFEKQQEKEQREKQRRADEERRKRSPAKRALSLRRFPSHTRDNSRDSSALGTPSSLSASAQFEVPPSTSTPEGEANPIQPDPIQPGEKLSNGVDAIAEAARVVTVDNSNAATEADLGVANIACVENENKKGLFDVGQSSPDLSAMASKEQESVAMQSLSSDDEEDSDPGFSLRFSDSMIKEQPSTVDAMEESAPEKSVLPEQAPPQQVQQTAEGEKQGKVPERKLLIMDDYVDSALIGRAPSQRLGASLTAKRIDGESGEFGPPKTQGTKPANPVQATVTPTTAQSGEPVEPKPIVQATSEKPIVQATSEKPIVQATSEKPRETVAPKPAQQPNPQPAQGEKEKKASEYVSKLFITMRSPQFILLQSFSALPGDFTPSFVFNLGDCNMTRIDTYTQIAVQEDDEEPLEEEWFDEELMELERRATREAVSSSDGELLTRRQHSSSIRRSASTEFSRHSSSNLTRYQVPKKEKLVKTLVHDQLHIHLEETSIYRALFNGFTLSHEEQLLIPTRISYTKEHKPNQPGNTELKMVHTRLICSSKDIEGAVKLQAVWEPIINLYTSVREVRKKEKKEERAASTALLNAHAQACANSPRDANDPMADDANAQQMQAQPAEQAEKAESLEDGEALEAARIKQRNEIADIQNLFFDGFSLVVIDDMSHKDWSVPILRIQTSSVTMYHTKFAIVPTYKTYLAINKLKLESYNEDLGAWEPTIEEVTFFINKTFMKPIFPEETDGKAEFIETVDIRFDEEVEFILAPSILNVGFFMKNTMNKISGASAADKSSGDANGSQSSSTPQSLGPTPSPSGNASLANSLAAKDRLKREASTHTMLHSAKSTANIREFAASTTTAVRNFSQSPPLTIVTPSGREKRPSSESAHSVSPYAHSAGQGTTPIQQQQQQQANNNSFHEPPSDALTASNAASTSHTPQSGLTPRHAGQGDTTPRALSAPQSLSVSREPPAPLPSDQDVLSIENHIGRPVVVWWTADKSVDVAAIQATDYTRVREWRGTYPRVVPKNQVAAFPVKSFSRETQDTDTKLSFYIQTEQVSKPIHGLQWNAVETHIRKDITEIATERVIIQVSNRDKGTKRITVRSDEVIYNDSDKSIEIVIAGKAGGAVNCTLAPYEKRGIPLDLASTHEIYVSSNSAEYKMSPWQRQAYIECAHVTKPNKFVYFSAIQRGLQIPNGQDFCLSIRPVLIIQNTFASELQFRTINMSKKHHSQQVSVAPGQSFQVIDPICVGPNLGISVRLESYQWTTPFQLSSISAMEVKADLRMYDKAGSGHLTIWVARKSEASDPCVRIVFYCEYWLINHTGLPMTYRRSFADEVIGEAWDYKKDWNKDEPRLYEIDPLRYYENYKVDTFLNGTLNVVYFDSDKVAFSPDRIVWSPSSPLHLHDVQMIDIDSEVTETKFKFALNVTPGPAKFWRTSIVRIFPAYFIVNNTSQRIRYKQFGISRGKVNQLEPNTQIPYHFPKKSIADLAFQFGTFFETEWSEPLFFERLRYMQVPIRDFAKKTGEKRTTYMNCEITTRNGVTYAILSDAKDALNKIRNMTRYDIAFKQLGVSDEEFVSSHGQTTEWYWDRPGNKDLNLWMKFFVPGNPNKSIFPITLNFLNFALLTSNRKSIRNHIGNGWINITIKGEGFTKIIVCEESDRPLESIEDIPKVPNWKLNVTLPTLCISIIDHRPRELFYITISEFEFAWRASGSDSTHSLSITDLQVDNQLHGSPQPVALWTWKKPRANTNANASLPAEYAPKFFDMYLSQDISQDNVSTSYREFRLSISPFFFTADTQLVVYTLALLNWFDRRTDNKKISEAKKLLQGEVPQLIAIDDELINATSFLYFQKFHIDPIETTINFCATKIPHDSHLKQTDIAMGVEYANFIPASLENVNLTFAPLDFYHEFECQHKFITKVRFVYTSSFLKQGLKVLGGLGFSGTLNVITSKAGDGMALLTMDDDYQNERDNEHKARTAGEGFSQGFQRFCESVVGGFTGVIVQPIKGGQKEGAIGALKGVGIGLAGIVTKPISGIVDFVAKSTEGLSNEGAYESAHFLRKQRNRPPRYFDESNVLLSYDLEKSVGQFLLYSVDNGIYWEDHYRWHKEVLPGQQIVVATNRHVISLKPSNVNKQWTTGWSIPLEQLHTKLELDPVQTRVTVWFYGNNMQLRSRTIQATNQKTTQQIFDLLVPLCTAIIPNVSRGEKGHSEQTVKDSIKKTKEGLLEYKTDTIFLIGDIWKKHKVYLNNGQFSFYLEDNTLVRHVTASQCLVFKPNVQGVFVVAVNKNEPLYFRCQSDKEAFEWVDALSLNGASKKD